MRKIFGTLFFIVVPFLMSYSQVKDENDYEVGGIYAFAFSKADDGSNYNISGPGAYFEYRHNFESKIYIGARADYRFANGPANDCNYNQFCIKALGGYTFCSGRVVNPFAGFGLGGGLLYGHRADNNNFINYSLVFTPIIGVQLNRFRLSCDLDTLCDSYKYNRSGWSVSTIGKRRLSIHTAIVSLNLGFHF